MQILRFAQNDIVRALFRHLSITGFDVYKMF